VYIPPDEVSTATSFTEDEVSTATSFTEDEVYGISTEEGRSLILQNRPGRRKGLELFNLQQGQDTPDMICNYHTVKLQEYHAHLVLIPIHQQQWNLKYKSQATMHGKTYTNIQFSHRIRYQRYYPSYPKLEYITSHTYEV